MDDYWSQNMVRFFCTSRSNICRNAHMNSWKLEHPSVHRKPKLTELFYWNVRRDEIMIDFLRGLIFDIFEKNKCSFFPTEFRFHETTVHQSNPWRLKKEESFCIFPFNSIACASGELICIEETTKLTSWFVFKGNFSEKNTFFCYHSSFTSYAWLDLIYEFQMLLQSKCHIASQSWWYFEPEVKAWKKNRILFGNHRM